LDEWEAFMVECIKYDLSEVKQDYWLRDLAEQIKPVSEAYFMRMMEDADDDNKSDPQEFRRMARELRERLRPKDGCIMREAAFNAGFGSTESSDSDAINTNETKATPKSNNQGRKRSGTQSLETNVSKKGLTECPACGMRGHSLTECWYIFSELKSKGMKLSAYCIQKTRWAIENDDELMEQVEEICRGSP